jgi:tetratricopeptide (TPR) repeat protein
VTSPFQTAYFAKVATSPAGLAYFPLLALGALSFLWNLPGWSWRRALPWLGLALLSAFQVRAVPFFAVVAGPVLALNLQEALARRPRLALPPGPARRREEVAGRVLATVAGVALIACAWPGWLQGQPYGRRSWAVEPSPALERGAAATLRWHRDGKLTAESRGLHLSPESAAAFAWLCPEEPAVVDEGLAAAVRGEESAGAGWEERMRSAGVDHVFVYDPDREGLLLTFGRLLADPHTWPLLYLEGDLAVFGWRDPNTAPDRDRFAGLRLDLDAVAFRSPGQSLAPRTGPDLAPPPWWAALRRPPPEPSIDHGEAVLHLMHAEALQLAAPFRQRIAWEYGQPAAVVGAAAGWTGPADLLNAQGRLVLLGKPPRPSGASLDTLPFADQVGLAWREVYAAGRDDVPPALLYLAIRAARRAVADDPQDARAYLVLGECYLRFLRGTRERAWSARMPRIAELRYAQASAALNRAVALKPDLAQAHLSLARLYGGSGYYDLALDHARSHLRLFRAAGPPRGVSADEFREEEEGLQEEVDRLAKEVEGRRQLLAAASGGADTLERALNASEKGLKKRALELLQESDVANFGARGMELELGLLLTAGRPQDVRDWTTPQHKEALGAASYHWLRARARAACGDYEAAEEECAAMLPAGADPVLLRRQMALRIGEAVLDEAPGGGEWPTVIRKFVSRPLFRERVFDLGRGLRQDADVRVVRGLLALEEGRTAEAGADFRLALEIWKNSETAASGGGMDFSGRGVAQDCLRWLGQEPPAR